MDGFILGKLGMKCRGENVSLLDKHRESVASAHNAHALAHPPNDRSPDEYHFQWMVWRSVGATGSVARSMGRGSASPLPSRNLSIVVLSPPGMMSAPTPFKSEACFTSFHAAPMRSSICACFSKSP